MVAVELDFIYIKMKRSLTILTEAIADGSD